MVALVLTSVALNFALARELRLSRPTAASGLEPGTLLPPIDGTTPNGQKVTVHFGEDVRPTVVYYFSPACGWCERNWPNVRALAAATDRRFRWIGISATTEEDLTAFATARGLDFSIVTSVNPNLLQDYQLTGTPHTLVIGRDSRLVTSWIGAFQSRLAADVETFFRVPLPGLGPASAPRRNLVYGDSRE